MRCSRCPQALNPVLSASRPVSYYCVPEVCRGMVPAPSPACAGEGWGEGPSPDIAFSASCPVAPQYFPGRNRDDGTCPWLA